MKHSIARWQTQGNIRNWLAMTETRGYAVATYPALHPPAHVHTPTATAGPLSLFLLLLQLAFLPTTR